MCNIRFLSLLLMLAFTIPEVSAQSESSAKYDKEVRFGVHAISVVRPIDHNSGSSTFAVPLELAFRLNRKKPSAWYWEIGTIYYRTQDYLNLDHSYYRVASILAGSGYRWQLSSFNLYGRIGLLPSWVKKESSNENPSYYKSIRMFQMNALVGVGAEYRFSENVKAFLGFDFSRKQQAGLSIGVAYAL